MTSDLLYIGMVAIAVAATVVLADFFDRLRGQ